MSNEIYAVEDSVIPYSLRKTSKRPGLLKRLLHKWITEVAQEEEMTKISRLGIDRSSPRIDSDKGIRFQVYKATGGFVIETSMYDRQKDRHYQSLHIVADDKNLGEEIGKIITVEALKQ